MPIYKLDRTVSDLAVMLLLLYSIMKHEKCYANIHTPHHTPTPARLKGEGFVKMQTLLGPVAKGDDQV